MKQFFLILSLLLLPLVGTDAAISTPFDSINALIPLLEGQKRLDAYTSLHYEAQHLDMKTELSVLYRYIDEAHRQGNVREEAFSRTCLVQCFSNYYEQDSLEAVLPATLSYLEKHESWKFYYFCRSLYVEALLDAERVESALRESNAIYTLAKEKESEVGSAFANMCMALTYQRMDRSEDAIAYIRKALEKFKGDPEYGDRMLYLYNILCRLLYRADRAGEGLAEALNFAHFLDTSPMSNSTDRFYCHLDLALGYAMEGQAASADSCLALARTGMDETLSFHMGYTDFLMHVSYYNHDYRRALTAADSLIAMNDRIEDHFSQIGALESRIKILRALDSVTVAPNPYARLALNDYACMITISDSLRTATSDAQLNDLHTLYKVDALESEAQLNKLQALIAIGGCLLLLVIVAIYIRYSARLRVKNRALYLQIQEHLRQLAASDHAADETGGKELSREQQLYRELEHLVREEKLYVQPDIDRKQLAVRLNTNERYLADAIHTATQETVTAYITRLRLDHALRLMTDAPNLTLHAIAADVGFTSYDPFLKAFVRHYGMTPSDYRKMLRGEKE